jgi:HupE / UreJ protein
VRDSLLQILRVVTAFTVGHSITLALAALGLVRVPTRPVEVLIALSIILSAVHALRPLFPGREARRPLRALQGKPSHIYTFLVNSFVFRRPGYALVENRFPMRVTGASSCQGGLAVARAALAQLGAHAKNTNTGATPRAQPEFSASDGV